MPWGGVASGLWGLRGSKPPRPGEIAQELNVRLGWDGGRGGILALRGGIWGFVCVHAKVSASQVAPLLRQPPESSAQPHASGSENTLGISTGFILDERTPPTLGLWQQTAPKASCVVPPVPSLQPEYCRILQCAPGQGQLGSLQTLWPGDVEGDGAAVVV